MFCSQCGAELKDQAQFCHQCGSAVAGAKSTGSKREAGGESPGRNWLHSFGAFLFIPLFALIIVLLFWSNREPEQLGATGAAPAAQSGAPNMAAMGQVHETLERLKNNIEENPNDLVSIDSLAVMYSIAGSYQKSKEYYEQHLAIEPDNKDIKIALALTYHNLNDNDKAVSLIQGVLDDDPGYAFALHYMAEIKTAMHEHDEANRYWQKIIDMYPGTEFAKMAQQRMQQQDSQ